MTKNPFEFSVRSNCKDDDKENMIYILVEKQAKEIDKLTTEIYRMTKEKALLESQNQDRKTKIEILNLQVEQHLREDDESEKYIEELHMEIIGFKNRIGHLGQRMSVLEDCLGLSNKKTTESGNFSDITDGLENDTYSHDKGTHKFGGKTGAFENSCLHLEKIQQPMPNYWDNGVNRNNTSVHDTEIDTEIETSVDDLEKENIVLRFKNKELRNENNSLQKEMDDLQKKNDRLNRVCTFQSGMIACIQQKTPTHYDTEDKGFEPVDGYSRHNIRILRLEREVFKQKSSNSMSNDKK
eukprot:Awhi_evm1s13890